MITSLLATFHNASGVVMLLVGYVFLGVLSNLMSLRHRSRSGQALTPVNPVAGLVVMALYALTATAQQMRSTAGTALFGGMVLLIAYMGVYRHVRNPPAHAYASALSRWLVVGINVLGVAAGLLALAN